MHWKRILSSQIFFYTWDFHVRSWSLKREETAERKIEKWDRRAEKDIGGKGDEWERPKEGKDAEEDDWGEDANNK